MSDEHPFQYLFESLARLPVAYAESVNRNAYEQLSGVLKVPLEHAGRCVLLKAPRAGHGKTHLLSRLQHFLAGSHEFVALHAAAGARIDAHSVLDDTLRRLVRPLPAGGGLTVLDLVVRRLFSEALQPLVRSGEVPCQDRDAAMAALRDRPVETFDFHHPNAVTAHWAGENFGILGPRLSLELSQRTGQMPRETGFWVDALFQFASSPLDQPGRAAALERLAFSEAPGDGVGMERLAALLGMLTLLGRVVLVADELEGFSADEGSALRLAAFVAAVRQSAERLDVILSLNQDIWETAFLPRLSGGLADRLSEVVVELGPLSEDDMVALLESRAPGLGAKVLEHMQPGQNETHARGVLKSAGATWIRAAREQREAAEKKALEAAAAAAAENAGDATPADDLEPSEESVSEAPEIEIAAASDESEPEAESEQPETDEEQPEAESDLPDELPELEGNEACVDEESAPEAQASDAETNPPAEAGGVSEAVEPVGDSGKETELAESVESESQEVPQGVSEGTGREPDRVDELLRQFRERYGRGGL